MLNRKTFGLRRGLALALHCLLLTTSLLPTTSSAQTLEEALLSEDLSSLAEAVKQNGDAARGAVIFHQAYLTCAKCHLSEQGQPPLGPNLADIGNQVAKSKILESVLQPSKEIKKGYATVQVITANGKTITGLFVEQTDEQLAVRDPSMGKLLRISSNDIEEKIDSKTSIMPQGLVNQLTSRQQFLDLGKYLFEIADGGRKRAAELKPPASMYVSKIPEYEKNIDHAGMISDLNDESFKRGQTIYNRLCINCHGDLKQPGSLPTSLRFASGKFKNGSDPHAMYQTLTKGYGMMVAQAWMVPQQKYDVIHYIREAYLKPHNATQYVSINQGYLDKLPKGDSRGPAPSNIEPWSQMDYGPRLVNTYEVGNDASNFAYKGIALRLDAGPGGVAKGNFWSIFDHDTMRVAAAWQGTGFIDWNGIHFNGRHGIHPRVVGEVQLQNKNGPGWARPGTEDFEDQRLVGRDKRRYGPVDRKWAHYKGMYRFQDQTIISYHVGETPILESHSLQSQEGLSIFERTLEIGDRSVYQTVQIANLPAGSKLIEDFRYKNEVSAILVGTQPKDNQQSESKDGVVSKSLAVALAGNIEGAKWSISDAGQLRLRFPKGKSIRVHIQHAAINGASDFESFTTAAVDSRQPMNLTERTQGGPARYTEVLKTRPIIGSDDGPFAVDVLTHPVNNPWFCRVRLTGIDFFDNGNEGIVSAWDGNIWHVSGLNEPEKGLSWKRIADGLFQPLGVKIVDNKKIFITCRDQLALLKDLNGDGEIDFYQSYNNDHQVTEHFHEFAMGLQTDDDGNFYYAKSARHAKKALVPHHGTLLRISKDGSKTDILARGFRAANGVCLNPDGSFIVTDQEGHWNPKNRINWVKKGGFYGNMWGYHDVTDTSDSAMEQPLCWITNAFDRSPSELLWVKSKAWGPLDGTLLNLSYGYGKVYVVPHEELNGQMQGGMCQIDIPKFPTGVMRGRFHPKNGQLYCCGMFAWAGTQHQPGGFYRIRYTGKPVQLPVGLSALSRGMKIDFSGELDKASAADAKNYRVKIWGLKRSGNYGSKHYNEREIKVTRATVSKDGKSVVLEIPEIQPTWCMEIKYDVRAVDGKRVKNTIHNTIHHLQKES